MQSGPPAATSRMGNTTTTPVFESLTAAIDTVRGGKAILSDGPANRLIKKSEDFHEIDDLSEYGKTICEILQRGAKRVGRKLAGDRNANMHLAAYWMSTVRPLPEVDPDLMLTASQSSQRLQKYLNMKPVR